VQRLIAGFEIGAGILAVEIEEKVVELILEIIVMRHIALRPADRVVLLDLSNQALPGVGKPNERDVLARRHVAAEQVEEIVDASAVNRDRAVHVGFTQRQARTQQQPYAGPPGVDPHGDAGPGTGTLYAMRPSGRVYDGQA